MLLKILLCFLAKSIQATFNTGQPNNYPRFFFSGNGDNVMHAMDANFETDTVAFAGYGWDFAFKNDPDPLNPLIACMFIEVPIYKWAKAASDIV